MSLYLNDIARLSKFAQLNLNTQRLSESKLNSIFASVPEAIVLADAPGRIVQCNAATAAIFAYAPGELVGQKIELLLEPAVEQHHDGYMKAYLATGHQKLINQPRVLKGRRKTGESFPVRLTIGEMGVDQGHLFIGVMQDFTAIQDAQDLLVEAKEKAEQANRMRGEFLATLSHEIRTPMNGILGMTELAMETQNDLSAQSDYLVLARDSAHHLLHIFNGILDFSKMEAGALGLELLEVSLAQLIRHTARSLEQLARAKHIDLIVETAGDVPDLVWLDPVRIRQVLTNLIGNAIKFTEHGGVTVKTQTFPGADEKSAVLQISIIDTGIGFDPARTEALFSPFTQADEIGRAHV